MNLVLCAMVEVAWGKSIFTFRNGRRWVCDRVAYRAARPHLDTATRDFSLSPPAERGERVGERGIDGFADLGGSGFPTGRPPLPSPLLQRRRGRSGRGLVAVSRCAPVHPAPSDFYFLLSAF